MSKFQDTMRRVITGDNAQGQSVVIIDGGPSSEIGSPDLGGLFEIWEDAAAGALTPSAHKASANTNRPKIMVGILFELGEQFARAIGMTR